MKDGLNRFLGEQCTERELLCRQVVVWRITALVAVALLVIMTALRMVGL
jgi:hypothetical protein